jgi:chromosome segregation ATPase
MADKKERLIDRDPDSNEENQSVPFYKNSTFVLVIKISLSLGVISSLLTGLILTNSRLTTLEEKYDESTALVSQLNEQADVAIQNLKVLKTEHDKLVRTVGTLDLGAAKGDLKEALVILDTQSAALDKQLAVTRNGMMSLSRMVKGSRVWQEDYRNQYQELFDENKRIKEAIKVLRGIQNEEHNEPKYLEMEF